ncbi:hypothetical protein PG995_004568 [Apiospora arundinis]
MLSCSYCESRGLSISEVPSADSARCDRSARHNQAQCDVQCLTSAQPRNIGAKHSKVQDELDAAEQELQRAAARVRRYRKKKKL